MVDGLLPPLVLDGGDGQRGSSGRLPHLFRFFGLFLVISEVGSQIYIANLAIECFQQLFGMKSHCMP